MKVSLFLLALMASACIVQTRALSLNTIKEKFDDVKATVTGKESEGERNDDKYEGGIVKKAVHSALDAGIDRAAHEVKDQYGNALTNPMISMAANKIKDKLHDTVSDLGEEPEDEPQEEGEHPPKEGEGEKDEGIVGKLIGKREGKGSQARKLNEESDSNAKTRRHEPRELRVNKDDDYLAKLRAVNVMAKINENKELRSLSEQIMRKSM